MPLNNFTQKTPDLVNLFKIRTFIFENDLIKNETIFIEGQYEEIKLID